MTSRQQAISFMAVTIHATASHHEPLTHVHSQGNLLPINSSIRLKSCGSLLLQRDCPQKHSTGFAGNYLCSADFAALSKAMIWHTPDGRGSNRASDMRLTQVAFWHGPELPWMRMGGCCDPPSARQMVNLSRDSDRSGGPKRNTETGSKSSSGNGLLRTVTSYSPRTPTQEQVAKHD